MTEEPELIAHVVGRVGRITLNRPKALNALTTDMVLAMTDALLRWRDDDEVRAVVVNGAGERAFCAGGDIRMLAESGRAGDDRAETFWREEYRLNTLIKRYPKPYVALIDGVTMGGGVGVSVHGSHRVAGDKTLLAMPETGIGFFPDVGGTYFLPRLPGAVGMWMGLTGARLKAADCVATGIATHFVLSENTERLIAALERADLDDDGAVLEDVLHDFEADPGDTRLGEWRSQIDAAFGETSVEAILAALTTDGSPWADEQIKVLGAKSPTSLSVTCRALVEGGSLEFEDAMRRELALSVACLSGDDFYEGVRSVIVDKDNAPQWRPARLEDVGEADLAKFFAPEREPEIAFLS